MNSYLKSELIGLAFILIFGTISHFVFEWLYQIPIIAPFFPTNESIFEHTKLIFFPALLFSIIGYYVFGKINGYWSTKIIAIVLATLSIPLLYYSYTSFMEGNFVIDIGIFVFSCILYFTISYLLLIKSIFANKNFDVLAKWLLFVITFIFAYLSFFPLPIEFFKDGVTNQYGIPK